MSKPLTIAILFLATCTAFGQQPRIPQDNYKHAMDEVRLSVESFDKAVVYCKLHPTRIMRYFVGHFSGWSTESCKAILARDKAVNEYMGLPEVKP